MWDRLTPDGRQVLRLALAEARESGQPCIADEHVLLGVLRHGTSQAAFLLQTRGLDLTTARAELLHNGSTLGSAADPVRALRKFGVDIEEVRRRLEVTFGADALQAAERRVRRRPRWRGGHPRPRPLCVYVWPNAPSRSPPGSPPTVASRQSGRTTCLRGTQGRARPAWHLAQPARPSTAGRLRLRCRVAQPCSPSPGSTRNRTGPTRRPPRRSTVTQALSTRCGHATIDASR